MSSWLGEFHDWTKKWDPLDHYALDGAWKSSTGLVHESSNGLVRVGNALGVNTSIPQYGADTSQKDKGSFSRWGENSLGTAGLIVGGMYGLGAAGGGGGAGAAGAGGVEGSVGGAGAAAGAGGAGIGEGVGAGAAGAGGVEGSIGGAGAANPAVSGIYQEAGASAPVDTGSYSRALDSQHAMGQWGQLLGQGMKNFGQVGGMGQSRSQPIAAVDFGAGDQKQQAYAQMLARALKQYGE